MKKFFFRFLKVLGVLIALYLIVALFAPSTYTVERSMTMKASPEVVFEQLSYFENWSNWSPWQEKDSTAVYKIEGEDGAVGAKYSWVGDPDLSGKGNLVIDEIIPNQKLAYTLTFEDWDMSSKGVVNLEATEDGTKVTWTDSGDFPFIMRPMALFMDMDAMIGPDFERGLFKMDSVSTVIEESVVAQYVINTIDFPETRYYGVRRKIAFGEIDSTFYGTHYGMLGAFVGEHGIEMAGMPVSFCFEWNESEEVAVLMPAFPVLDNSVASTGDIEAYTQIAGKALVIDYYGPYEESGAAHAQMEIYLEANGLNSDLVMEEYVTDPTTVESMDQVLTRIYYFLK